MINSDHLSILEKIPIEGKRTIVHFSGGEQGPGESGEYCFWTMEGEDEFGPWRSIGRAQTMEDPRYRFEIMANERFGEGEGTHLDIDSMAIYSAIWHRIPSAQLIRGSTYRDVASWMAGHRRDAIYAMPNWICQGKKIIGLPPREIV